MLHNYETEKITRKDSGAAENLQLYSWVLPPKIVMHDDTFNVFSERPPIYVSCMTISGGRTEQHLIIGFGELATVD